MYKIGTYFWSVRKILEEFFLVPKYTLMVPRVPNESTLDPRVSLDIFL